MSRQIDAELRFTQIIISGYDTVWWRIKFQFELRLCVNHVVRTMRSAKTSVRAQSGKLPKVGSSRNRRLFATAPRRVASTAWGENSLQAESNSGPRGFPRTDKSLGPLCGKDTNQSVQGAESSALLEPTIQQEPPVERILSLFFANGRVGAAYFKVSVGELSVLRESCETSDYFVTRKLLAMTSPTHLITNLSLSDAHYEAIDKIILKDLQLQTAVSSFSPAHFGAEKAKQRLFAVRTLYDDATVPVGETRRLAALSRRVQLIDVLTIRAAGGLLHYLDSLVFVAKDPRTGLAAVSDFSQIHLSNMVNVDQNAYRSLRIFHRDSHPSAFKRGMRGHAGEREGLSLFSLISDFCHTKVGKQQLRVWFQRPTNDLTVLNDRLDQIEIFSDGQLKQFVDHLCKLFSYCESVNHILDVVQVSQLGCGNWGSLYKTLYGYLSIWSSCSELSLPRVPTTIAKVIGQVEKVALERICLMINGIINIEKTANEKRVVINQGVCPELDQLRKKYEELQSALEAISMREGARLSRYLTPAADLGMVYLPKLGYFLCVKKCGLSANVADFALPGLHIHDVSHDAIIYRSEWTQQLQNEYGDIQSAIVERECVCLTMLQEAVAKRSAVIRKMTDCVAELDAVVALARAAQRFGFVRPELVEDASLIEVEEGRHPLQEALWISAGGRVAQEATTGTRALVPNDVQIGRNNDRVTVINGPNGSGKTVFIKQVGLIVFMAHIGCFVPAKRARIGLVDALFTRICTLDSVTLSMSSFCIELNQVATMVKYSSQRSLLLIDEFGNSSEMTSGVTLLSSVVKHLIERRDGCPLVLITTHFPLLKYGLLARSSLLRFATMEVAIAQQNNADCLVYLFKLRDLGANTATDSLIRSNLPLLPDSNTSGGSASLIDAYNNADGRSFAMLVAERQQFEPTVLQRANQALRNMQVCGTEAALCACGSPGNRRIIFESFKVLLSLFKQVDLRRENVEEFMQVKVVSDFRKLELRLKQIEEETKVAEEKINDQIRSMNNIS